MMIFINYAKKKDILINWLCERLIANLQSAACEICSIGKLQLQKDSHLVKAVCICVVHTGVAARKYYLGKVLA